LGCEKTYGANPSDGLTSQPNASATMEGTCLTETDMDRLASIWEPIGEVGQQAKEED